ncbi:exonuclease subunit SbcD [Martelella alba]|uniref:Nuclease SbcCD subunit D n=1 Tax=Martelella alba TaxID=2590451 RepID=A0ABY2SLD7_9HYPH|nr:exonuclease subunit SbcD [Martelella alba]TKI06321.1 exonuclease subunit SbcD [Martelella alba]
MRIIHTSDWHLGQSFYTKNRAREHQTFLRWLIEQVERYHVDAVLVVGDIFDTGTPPSYARELFNRFVTDLQPTGCQLIVLGGNHDAAATLNESRDLLACLHTRVIARADGQQVFPLNKRNGKPGAILCAVPFLRARDLLASRPGESADDKQRALAQAIADHYRQCHEQALALRSTLPSPVPIVATGHLTVVGASTSESVRDIYIGSLEAFPAQRFPPVDYLALGHIHRPQVVNVDPPIHYCGSPIALSFDEAGQTKQVNLVTFADGRKAEITPLPIPEVQPMRLLSGTAEQIETQLRALESSQGGQPIWLDIEVTTDDWLNDIQQRIRQTAADLPVEIVLLRRNREQRLRSLAQSPRETLAELSVEEVFERRLSQVAGKEAADLERIRQLYAQVVADLRLASPPEEQAS